MSKGKLIVIEGPDGVGKTTLAEQLVKQLNNRRRGFYEYFSYPGRVPGTLGHTVYQIHHDPFRVVGGSVTPAAIQALHIAAHLDVIEQQLLPKLQVGLSVVLDRYWWSTLVYGLANQVSFRILESLIQAERYAWSEVQPEIVFLLVTNKPLRPLSIPDAEWENLGSRYRTLALDEMDRHQVVRINNRVDQVDQTLTNMLNHLS